jgi:micrococcal nuclease
MSTPYLYKATLLDVIDGDTIWVHVDVGFEIMTKEKLRFKGIDSPELKTTDGQKARDFIIQELSPCPFFTIQTFWRDKYARLLADIYYNPNETAFERLMETGTHLNQELLRQKLAAPYA